MSTRIKVYVVQRMLPSGALDPTILACKLTHLAAHLIAKEHAPARVTSLVADKSSDLNGEPPSTAAEEAAVGSHWN